MTTTVATKFPNLAQCCAETIAATFNDGSTFERCATCDKALIYDGGAWRYAASNTTAADAAQRLRTDAEYIEKRDAGRKRFQESQAAVSLSTPSDRGEATATKPNLIQAFAFLLPTEMQAELDRLLQRDAAFDAMRDALRAVLPTCGFIVDRDKGTECGELAPWSGSFGLRYCEGHQEQRIRDGRIKRGEGYYHEDVARGIAALALADPQP